MYFALKPNSASEAIEVLGYSLKEGVGLSTQATGVAWSVRAIDLFRSISSIALSTGDSAGQRLPYASLRALLSATLPAPLFVASDLSLPGPKSPNDRPFTFNIAECNGLPDECQKALNTGVRRWVGQVLSPWAAARGIPSDLVSSISSLAIANELTVTSSRLIDTAVPAPTIPFADLRDSIHAALFRNLAGAELFPGMGASRCLIRSWSKDNTISFLTFPKRVEGGAKGSYSMQARLSVETFPGQSLPFVRLDVSRVRWCPKVPTTFMPRQRKLTATIFGDDQFRTVSFEVPVLKGNVQDPEDPAFATLALRAGIDVGQPFSSLIEAGPQDGAFVGIRFAPAYEPAPAVATGATEFDWLDCYDRILAQSHGLLTPIETTSVPSSKRVVRKKSDIPAVKATQILEQIARDLGHNDIDNAAIADAWDVLYGDQPPSGVEIGPKASEARERFDALRNGNSDRLRKTFGDKVPTIVVLSASAVDGAAIVEVARRLFAGNVRIESRLLPEGVHGPRKELAASDAKASERYEARLEAWKPLAQKLREDLGPSRVLVHAKRFRDDGVNKIAGRVALARYGDCNVQYLDGRGHNANDWFFRIQAAILDLMFGHSGLVSPVAENIEQAFPDPTSRPKSIIGVSVVSQNRTYSRSSSSFFLSVAIDVRTGQTTATAACPKDGDLEFKGPLPFFDLLKAVAGWEGTTIGSSETAKAAFQDFLSEIVGTACERGERPLVMIDGAHARGLWNALSNAGWGTPATIAGHPFDPSREWPGARIVRIQDTIEPTVLTRKTRLLVELDEVSGKPGKEFTNFIPTLTGPGRLVRIGGTAPNYISSGDLDGQQKIAKGLSVYRQQPAYRKVKDVIPPTELSGWEVYTDVARDLTNEPYKLAGVIGILVAFHQPEDDPDRIASLCHGLRNGFGHTRSPTRLPAPLFHTRKVAEYIPAFVLDDDDIDEAADEAVVTDDALEDGGTGDSEVTILTQPEPDSASASGSPSWRAGDNASRISAPLIPSKSTNPLLALAEGAPFSLDRPGLLDSVSKSLPLSGAAASRKGELAFPAELRERANGDDDLISLMERSWVGPLPSFLNEKWLAPLLGQAVSLKARQQLADALSGVVFPASRVLPELDMTSDESLATVILGLMCVGDGFHFLRFAIARQFAKNQRRWIFNQLFDQVHRQARQIKRAEPASSTISALMSGNFALAKQLHEAGHLDILRQFLVIEPLFMGFVSPQFAETAARLESVFGGDYSEVAAFCARLARYQLEHRDVRSAAHEWSEKQRSLKASRKLGIADMRDGNEVAELEAIPATPAPGIDTSFLRDKISLSGAFRSHLHAHREIIRTAIGDQSAWPDEKPSAEQITGCIAALFSAPIPVLAAVSERDKESLFRPFYRKIEMAVRTIDEGRPPEDRLNLMQAWTTTGFAPAVVLYLAARGYKAYASELALVRAVQNPSIALELAAEEIGEPLAEAAAFIRARRRATLWFVSNDERAEDEVFASSLGIFEEGEIPVVDQKEQTESADEIITATLQEPPESDSGGEAVGGMTLDRVFKDIVDLARKGHDAHAGRDFKTLDTVVAELERLTADLGILVTGISKTVSNRALIEKADEVRAELLQLARTVRSELTIQTMPSIGEIDPQAAVQAHDELMKAESDVEGLKRAIRGAEDIRAKSSQLDVFDAIGSMEQVRQQLEQTREHLSLVVDTFNETLKLLTPEVSLVPEATVELEPAAKPVPDELPTSDNDQSDLRDADEYPAFPTETLAHVEIDGGDEPDEELSEIVTDEFDVVELESIAPSDPTHSEPLAGPVHSDMLATEDEIPELDEFSQQDIARIDAALESLVERGSFGLAYQLARAAEIEAPDRPLCVTSIETKLAALAGHLNHTALQSNVELVRGWVQDAFKAADIIEDDPDRERATARLMNLMPLMIELGIFFPALGGAEFLRKLTSLPGELGTVAQKVFDSIGRIQHTNVVFSRAMLANVANELDCSKAVTDMRMLIIKKIDAFAGAKFDFQLAAKIRNELYKSDNLIGGLRAQLLKGKDDEKTLATISSFVEGVSDRARILELFGDVEVTINDRYQGLDGVARNRMVTFFEDLRDLAHGYIELMSEVEEAKATERPKVREYAKHIAKAVGEMISAVNAAANDLGRVANAAKHVSPRLEKLANIMSGETGMSVASSYDIYQACHAELAMIPSLEYGRSWLPSPYHPAQIVDLLCDQPHPLLPDDADGKSEAFETAIRARLDRSSYVGAKLLLDAAPFLGIDETLVARLSGDLETEVPAAKDGMREEFEQLRRMVERVVRFGSLKQGSDAEEAAGMLDRINNLEAMRVPAEVGPGDRTEEEMDGVYDVSVAIDELENIRSEAQQLLDEPRNRLEKRIDELEIGGTNAALIDQLRRLCQKDDLLTAEEHIDEVAKTGKISESRRRNARITTFMDNVLPSLEHHRQDFSREAAAAIRDGLSFGSLSFEPLSDARREESAAAIEMWRDLFRRFHDRSFAAPLSAFLDKIGINAVLDNMVPNTGVAHKIFVGDFKASIPTDQESLLLPDFGSRTDGMYRFIVTQSMPTDALISEHCKVGKLGVIILVNDIISGNHRRTFHLRNLAESRRVILIDSATLLFALGEPAIRPLTLIELAQPYSFVAPYNDWGNDAVPPEMFVGREEDLARILDPEGSNVVYGGRRMGKTAIFRHLVGVNHAPEKGTLVAYVDAREIGRGNTATKVVWSAIARELSDIFGNVIPQDPRRVRESIEAWIAQDSRRRILLLLDECDQFVVSDASNDYSEFLELQRLMTMTKRRFKVVLAGLSDVTRLVQTGNPPLRQIAANPRRIGSLTGDERGDAEDLLLRPFAALGLELDHTDVWRILSYSNYYPVLIQTYAQRILQAVIDLMKVMQRPMRKVPAELIARVLEDDVTRQEIKRIFEATLGIDPRYRLIAFVVANLVFQAEVEGRIDDGFPLHQIRDNAINFWEAGFQDLNRFSLFDDLLDEMEGLGIVRRVNGDRWTLRSSAVVRLLGNRDEIESAILQFGDKESPVGFDPKSHRRELPTAKNVLPERRSSPLTLGQERELLLTRARAIVILGNRLSDYPLAAHAIRSVPESFPDGELFDTGMLSASSPAELDAALKELKLTAGKKLIAIVPAAVPWASDWVRTAINSRPVARGDIRLVFVGGPEHASSVFGDEELAALTSHVDIVPLEPWSTAYFNYLVNKTNVVSVPHKFETCVAVNGGWNAPMWGLFHGKKTPEVPEPDALGLLGRYGQAISTIAAEHGLSPIALSDIQEYLQLVDDLSTLDVSAKSVLNYGMALGLLQTAPGKPGTEKDRTRYVLSSVSAKALGVERKAAAE